jgi:hypothetical protein
MTTTTTTTRPGGRLRTYNAAFALTCIALLALMGLSYQFLLRTGDIVAPSEAAARQETEDVLFGSALFFRPVPYKLALYRLRKPDVAVVGSSRAIQFIRRGFTRSMVNMGSMRDLAQIDALLRAMLAAERPRLIILTIDFWWFNRARTEEAADLQPDGQGQLSLVQLGKPFAWIAEGKIGVGDFLAGALLPSYQPDGIGVAAIFDHAGYDRDGAYDYGGQLRGRQRHIDAGFKRTLFRIGETHAHNKFNMRAPFDEAEWRHLLDIIAMIESQGIELIIVLPPVSKTVADALAAGGTPTLLAELNARLTGLGRPVFDFHDPTALGSGECEFIDGFHGGRVTYLRMLAAIVKSGRTPLADYVDQELIEQMIAANAGHAMLKEDMEPGEPETDFLQLGCVK